jgi:micrococcal nuclease
MIFFGRSRPTMPATISMRGFYIRRALTVCVFTFTVLGLAILSDCSVGRPVGGDQAKYHNQSFQVVYVVDGDTFDINMPDGKYEKTRIRLWGVDTPEVGRNGKPDMHFGPQASEFAEKTLLGTQVHVVLSPKRTRDKYGRLLAFVFMQRGGAMFNEMLIEQGFAYADLRFDHQYRRRFETVDKRARKKKIGLWADVTIEQMPEWKQRFERRRQERRKD